MSKTFLVLVPVFIIMLIRLKPFDIILRTLNTFLHELSHAVVALIFREKVQQINLNQDFSGSCTTKVHSKFAQTCIALAGYTFTSLIAYILICNLNKEISSLFFWIFVAICVLAIIMYIRNAFGIIWVLAFTAINFLFIYIPLFKPYYNHIIYIYACIILIENLLSTFTLLYITIKSPKQAGDATLLQKASKVPAIIWSLAFVIIAILLTIKSINLIPILAK